MYCKKCGKQILEDSKFCESCGAKIEAEIILEGGSFTEPPKFSVPLNSSGKILESPAPFENKMNIFSLGYAIIPVVMIIIGLILGNSISGMFILGLIFDIFWLIIKNIIAGGKIVYGNCIDYDLPMNVSPDELSSIVAKPFAEIYMPLERTGDVLTIRYDKVFFDIYIDNDKGTFHILPYQSFASKAFGKRNITLYRKAATALPLIIFTIQNELRNKN